MQLLQEYTPEDVSTTAATLPESKLKNRYPDALPCKIACLLLILQNKWMPENTLFFFFFLFSFTTLPDDHTRVKLSVPDNETGSDYINASFIVGNQNWQKAQTSTL